MKLQTGGMMLLVFVFAAGIGYAVDPQPAQPPAQGENPPAQPPAQPPADESMAPYTCTVGHVTVTGTKPWKDVIDKLAAKINKALDGPIAKFGLETKASIQFGLAPMPAEKVAEVTSVVIPTEQDSTVHYVMAVAEGTQDKFDINSMTTAAQIYLCLNVAYAMEIPAVQPEVLKSYPKWFWLGFTAYCGMLAAQDLAGDESYRLYNSLFGEKKLELFNEKLLTWNWKEKLQTDEYFGRVCAEIFIQIEKQFGPDALVKIGQGLAAAPKADKDALVKVISDAIGQDFAAWLKNFKCTAKYHVIGFNADGQYTGPGVKAASITPDSAAAEAGFQKDDIIVKINGTEIRDNPQLGHVLAGIGVGGKVVATVKRGDKEIELTATLRERTVFTFDVSEFPTPPPPTPQSEEGEPRA
jgi:hypothetical protein